MKETLKAKKRFTITSVTMAENVICALCGLLPGETYEAEMWFNSVKYGIKPHIESIEPRTIKFKYLGIQDNSKYNKLTEEENDFVRKYNTYSLNVEVIDGDPYGYYKGIFMNFGIGSYKNWKYGMKLFCGQTVCRADYVDAIESEFNMMIKNVIWVI